MFIKLVAAYLCLTVLARRAHDVVSARRSYLAHAILARVVLLRIVLNLWWGQPRVFSRRSITLPTSVWSV
jgi:hypothetical protein